MELDEKPCPFCAETIKSAAIKCKHCGEFIEHSGSSTTDERARSRASDARGDHEEGGIESGTSVDAVSSSRDTGEHRRARARLDWRAAAILGVVAIVAIVAVVAIVGSRHRTDSPCVAQATSWTKRIANGDAKLSEAESLLDAPTYQVVKDALFSQIGGNVLGVDDSHGMSPDASRLIRNECGA